MMAAVPMARRFPISELRARTGTPPATIHHYLRLGLLPKPARGPGRRYLYDDRHVQRLRLIRVLSRRRGLGLADIRRILPDLSALEDEQAFRPEMWDRVMGRRLAGHDAGAPAARLLRAATEAFARRGYAEVNVEDICRAAGVGKGSFYRHYRSKEEVFLAAAGAAAGEVAEAFGRAAGTRIAEDRGAEVLAGLLEPRLPLFLDLLSGALQRRPGYREAAGKVLGSLTRSVGRLLRGHAPPEISGSRLVGRAVALVVSEAGRGAIVPAAR